MIDLHCHLLPGIDDGPEDVAGALGLARALVAQGVSVVCCTPHMTDTHPNDPARVREGVMHLQRLLDEREIPLRLVPGGEVRLPYLVRMSDGELRDAALGGSPWVLMELPRRGWPLNLPAVLADLEIRGFGTVIAHPERYESVQTHPDRMRDIVGRGALLQMNASSLLGGSGSRARATAEALLRNGMITFIASDAHSADERPPVMREALAEASRLLAVPEHDLRWMVQEGPRALLAGEAVRPPRLVPATTRRERPGPR